MSSSPSSSSSSSSPSIRLDKFSSRRYRSRSARLAKEKDPQSRTSRAFSLNRDDEGRISAFNNRWRDNSSSNSSTTTSDRRRFTTNIDTGTSSPSIWNLDTSNNSLSSSGTSLLKYEVRHLTNLRKIRTGDHSFGGDSTFRIRQRERNNNKNVTLPTRELKRRDGLEDVNFTSSSTAFRRIRKTSEGEGNIENIMSSSVRSKSSSMSRSPTSLSSPSSTTTPSSKTSPKSSRSSLASNSTTVRSTRSRSTTPPDAKNSLKVEECQQCKKLQNTITTLEYRLEQEKQIQTNNEKLHELEGQFENLLVEKDNFTKQVKKLQKDIKRINNNLEDEKVQTRRLGIKLEDANYEIGRLRQELINSQLENEKIVEDNEDLAVDNEDLIKERDEIIQIYDELFRESERLKHEVKIWKTVFENNKQNLPNDAVREEEEKEIEEEKPLPSSSSSEDEDDEGLGSEVEEDQSLLLTPRDDITLKSCDVSSTFDLGDEIARGKFGKVYKITEKSCGDLYAAKYIKTTSKLREDVLNTIDLMKRMHHVRLMRLYDVYDLGAQIVCILEYVGGGMLFERIVESNSLTEADCAVYMKQILQGLHHMHANQIAHLELKPENIVCANRQTMDVKIIDFGLAKQLEHKKDMKITAGSPEFVAPEILSFDPVSLSSDLWSIGVITYVLLSGISPFIGDDDNDTLMNVSCGEFTYDEECFKNITEDAKKFIERLLVSTPKKRGTVSQCLQHPWLNTNFKNKQEQIHLENMKKFLEKRKEKGNISAARSIRRFSSFGHVVGHWLSKNSGKKMALKSSSRQLLSVPNSIQSATISEDGEVGEKNLDNVNNNNNSSNHSNNNNSSNHSYSNNKPVTNGPTKLTPRGSGNSTKERSRTSSDDESSAPPEDISTPHGLRTYLERMISTGVLPGGEQPSPSESPVAGRPL